MSAVEVADTGDVRRVIGTAMGLRGMTQTDLARGLGMSQAQVSRLLSGQRAMSVNVMFRLARFLDLTLAFIPEDA